MQAQNSTMSQALYYVHLFLLSHVTIPISQSNIYDYSQFPYNTSEHQNFLLFACHINGFIILKSKTIFAPTPVFSLSLFLSFFFFFFGHPTMAHGVSRSRISSVLQLQPCSSSGSFLTPLFQAGDWTYISEPGSQHTSDTADPVVPQQGLL